MKTFKHFMSPLIIAAMAIALTSCSSDSGGDNPRNILTIAGTEYDVVRTRYQIPDNESYIKFEIFTSSSLVNSDDYRLTVEAPISWSNTGSYYKWTQTSGWSIRLDSGGAPPLEYSVSARPYISGNVGITSGEMAFYGYGGDRYKLTININFKDGNTFKMVKCEFIGDMTFVPNPGEVPGGLRDIF